MRRIIAAAALTAVFALVAGCSSTTYGASNTVKFYSDKMNWETYYEDMSKHSAEAIDVGLDIYSYSDTLQYNAFIKQVMITKERPTLFTWHTGPDLASLVDNDYLVTTDSIWKDRIASGDIPEDLIKEFTVGKHQYCVPLNSLYNVMYYNVAVFKKAGITKIPATWDELMATADKIVKAGYIPFYQTNQVFSFTWFQTLVGGQDPQLYSDLMAGKAKYTDPRIVKAMDMWQSMEKKGYFSDPSKTWSESAALASGQIAMLNWESFVDGTIQQNGLKPVTGYNTFVIPPVNPSLKQTPIFSELSPLCLTKKSPEQDSGEKYLEWWTTQPAQSVWAADLQSMSFDPKAKAASPALKPVQEALAKGGFNVLQRWYDLAPAPIQAVGLQEFGAFVTNPTDPKKHLERIQNEADKYWAGN